MAGKALHLRCKSKHGQHVLSGITAATTVAQFKQKLAELTRIQQSAIKILHGFPPRRLDLSDPLATMTTIGLQSGDTLIIEEDTAGAPSGSASEAVAPHPSVVADAVVSEQLQHTKNGILMRRVVPSDNSCLFTSVNYALTGNMDLACSQNMRKLIAKCVRSDKDTYCAAFLEKPNEEYAKWILKDENWGGAIELSILAKYYTTEIAVLDTQTGRIDRYGEDANFPNRIMLVYDGLHYDPLVLEPSSPAGTSQTIFSTADEHIWAQALELGAEAKSSRQYTDVNKFSLRCLVCDVRLVGQKEAESHALSSGHTNFGEV